MHSRSCAQNTRSTPPVIALSGGPGAGKTHIASALVAANPSQVQVVPEVSTLLLTHLFPAIHSPQERRAFQRALYYTQLGLEEVALAREGDTRPLLCDRGTIDGAAYWPDGSEAFFRTMGSSLETELQRYQAVVFLETAALGGLPIHEGNPTRQEDCVAATQIHHRLYALWVQHPNFYYLPHQPNFSHKVRLGAELIERQLKQVASQPERP